MGERFGGNGGYPVSEICLDEMKEITHTVRMYVCMYVRMVIAGEGCRLGDLCTWCVFCHPGPDGER